MKPYNFLDRLLHRLTLQFPLVAEFSFDLDQQTVNSNPEHIITERHVFVSGLARSGTTILMRHFYATGAYHSLTYRDMPLVLAPNIWGKLTRFSKRTTTAMERAHGDSIEIDMDSPEEFDEVFWRVFCGEEYIKKTYLTTHSPDSETIWKYICYVNAVLNAKGKRASRYLCKNNNNILRLKSVRQAFPDAVILIPFRSPLFHAESLLRQHRNFLKMQKSDSFVRLYMTWLVHHEFGQDHRPFRFETNDMSSNSAYDVDTVDYWLELWCKVYEWLEHAAPEDAVFVCYEQLCSNADVWRNLMRIAQIDAIDTKCAPFHLGNRRIETAYNIDLAERASATYARLLKRSSEALDVPLAM